MLQYNKTIFFKDQGGREYMEDRIDICETLIRDYEYYAVFDGHGGSDIVEYVHQNMRGLLINLINNKDAMQLNEDDILYQGLKTIVERLPMSVAKHQGTTAVLVLRRAREMWIANCGDSRAIVSLSNGKSIQLTDDHKPNREDEYRRIISQGGFVAPSYRGDVYRVNGSLAVSRSIGDLSLFPHVTWKPEITYASIAPTFKFLVLATDGIWDVLQNNDVSTILNIQSTNNVNNVAKDICALARTRGSTDNISVVIVRL
jgi:serine/threonine protein phosphatase PrpC